MMQKINHELDDNESSLNALHNVSDDEWQIDNSHLLEEDNQKMSFDSI